MYCFMIAANLQLRLFWKLVFCLKKNVFGAAPEQLIQKLVRMGDTRSSMMEEDIHGIIHMHDGNTARLLSKQSY